METLRGILNTTAKIMHDPRMKDFITVVQNVLTIVGTVFPPAALPAGLIKASLSILGCVNGVEGMEHQDELRNMLKTLIDKMEYLNENVEWQSVLTQYHEEITTLKDLSERLVAIAEATTDEDRDACVRDLDELIERVNIETYLNTLFDGLDKDDEDLMSSQILETYYKFSNGDKPQLEKLSDELMSLLLNGITALYLHKRLKGTTDLERIEKKFEVKLNTVQKSIESILKMCRQNYKENLKGDLKTILLGKDANCLALGENSQTCEAEVRLVRGLLRCLQRERKRTV